MSALLPDGAEWIDIVVPLDNVFDQYSRHEDNIVVFASGDPLFFGFANTIRRRLPDATITLHPAFNSLQTLAHRLLMEYDDMRIVSLTGRPWPEFDKTLIEGTGKIGVLTDRTHSPSAIAERMVNYGYTDYEMFVGEHLGNPGKEKISAIDIRSAIQDFEYPNCLILKAIEGKKRQRRFGLPDHEFALLDGRERMITKMPIRLLSLQAMQLQARSVMWDIGFCTGSVSIEARLQFPHLQVVAFEIRSEGEKLMEENARRFGAPGITAIIADFLKADLSALPRPDAVFIGGHGGRLPEIIERLYPLLQRGGCIVMNSVTESSHNVFINTTNTLGLTLDSEEHIALNDYNPITILKATKE